MAKQCPPGVICIENATMLMVGCILIGIIYLANSYHSKILIHNMAHNSVAHNSVAHNSVAHNSTHNMAQPRHQTQKGLPINVPTQPIDSSYRQIGILSRNNDQDVIMGLFGMQMNRGRDLWQYYTTTEHGIRLPISVNGKSGSVEYGCDPIENGDMIYVEGYNDAFRATIYDDNNRMRYIPLV
jgi:hypothetical protein